MNIKETAKEIQRLLQPGYFNQIFQDKEGTLHALYGVGDMPNCKCIYYNNLDDCEKKLPSQRDIGEELALWKREGLINR